MNAAALEVLRVPRWTDRFQTQSARSSTKQALVSCLETSLKVQGRCGMVQPQELQPPCPSETWSTGRAPLLADGDGNGGCPFGMATIPARAASLSSWCPSCGTAGSHPGGLGGLLRWNRQWGCSSLCGLGSAASRHGWVSLTKDCEGCLCKGCSQAEATWD